MTTLDTANTSSELVRSAQSPALRVAFRELELYDTGDLEGADEVFSPDLVDHNGDPSISGIDGMRALIVAVRDGFTDVQHRVVFYQEMADGWVGMHWHMTATHTGDAFGVAASGRKVSINGSDFMRIVDGKIAEIYHVEELLKLVGQLNGDVPA
jgi:predicted ester cyclase